MKLIYISDNGRHHKKLEISSWSIIAILLMISVSISALFFYVKVSNNKPLDARAISKHEIEVLKKFDSMLLKTAELEAQVKRLNSLSKNIATKSNLDIDQYKLSKAPAMGGIDGVSSPIISQDSLSKSIEALELELELAEKRYGIIKEIQSQQQEQLKLVEKKQLINSTSFPFTYAIPVKAGYVSSRFGKRRDPISGHRRHHSGIDIAARLGSKIHTIASGVVLFSGRKGGYGKVVDIRHSDSLITRYAHLNTMKVKKGDVVKKGEIIATMGRTGRATGTHLHFEVWKNNRPVNPQTYIDTSLIK